MGGHVAIDGKTLRRSFDAALGGKAIHMVSAWLSEQGLVLGPVKVAEKANEIVFTVAPAVASARVCG
ncbi:MAG: hypothetical protein EXR71_13950 [Myxococcales bacterium]|nr:hypothetical protein [Myxococcales bacterium]